MLNQFSRSELVIDERGVPIDFTVFPGNKSEYHQVLPAIERLKEKYHVKDCYFVADRGLNSTLNFDALLKGGFGFIVAQKVTGQSKKQEKIMLSEEGWNKLTFSPLRRCIRHCSVSLFRSLPIRYI